MAAEPLRINAMLDRCSLIGFSVRADRMKEDKFGHDLFSTPAMDILLDLYMQKDRKARSLTSLCVAAGGSERTALRIIQRLVQRGYLRRSPDPDDARRVNAELTEEAIALLDQYFDSLLAVIASPDIQRICASA